MYRKDIQIKELELLKRNQGSLDSEITNYQKQITNLNKELLKLQNDLNQAGLDESNLK